MDYTLDCRPFRRLVMRTADGRHLAESFPLAPTTGASLESREWVLAGCSRRRGWAN
jgi:hypothetical protein